MGNRPKIGANRFYISTIAADAPAAAGAYGMGLEIAQYCTAWNMDDHFPETDAQVREELEGVRRRTFHAPFNELFPCAIDPQARELARRRYRQAIGLAVGYGAEKIVIHGGFLPRVYYPVWYIEQSILFWREFLADAPGIPIVLENVLESEPEMLLAIAQGVDSPNLGICLDVGHANAYSRHSVGRWLEVCAPYIRHFHLHNNDGSADSHSPLAAGTIPMAALLERAAALCPEATFALEVAEAASSCTFLEENHFL